MANRIVFATCEAANEVKFALVAAGLGAFVTTIKEPLRADARFDFAGHAGEWAVSAELRDARTGNVVVRDVDGNLDVAQIKSLAKSMRAELKAKAALTSARIAAERGAR